MTVVVDPENLTPVQGEALGEVAAGRVKVRHNTAGVVYFTHVGGSGYGSVLHVAYLRAAGLVRVTGGGRARLTAAGKRALAQGIAHATTGATS